MRFILYYIEIYFYQLVWYYLFYVVCLEWWCFYIYFGIEFFYIMYVFFEYLLFVVFDVKDLKRDKVKKKICLVMLNDC